MNDSIRTFYIGTMYKNFFVLPFQVITISLFLQLQLKFVPNGMKNNWSIVGHSLDIQHGVCSVSNNQMTFKDLMSMVLEFWHEQFLDSRGVTQFSCMPGSIPWDEISKAGVVVFQTTVEFSLP